MTTETLLSNVVYGTPSGNYDGSSQDWTSDAVQAADYYRGRGSLQTVLITVTGFEGYLYVDATLDADPATEQWFSIASFGDGSTADSATITTLHYESVLGNFTWLRAVVTNFTDGTIELVSATY